MSEAAPNGAPMLLEVDHISKSFGTVQAIKDVTMSVGPAEVMCLLGDNGAGKSTLIKMLSGVHRPDTGTYKVEGQEVVFNSPRDALAYGIATVYQDLAMIPLLSITRNFFLGSEPTRGFGPFKVFDIATADRIVRGELDHMGIAVRDTSQTVGTMSGGERQSVAIARAVHFGAKVLILDEPTSALGVKQAGVVLKYVVQAKQRGCGVIFITHNPHHAWLVGDRFTILNRGRSLGTYTKKGLAEIGVAAPAPGADQITLEELVSMMAGGRELAELSHEIEQFTATGAAAAAEVRQETAT
ncbi:MAG: ATP-binding cassette domain-containing protein [Candidatus Dormibacteraeota bacterium]|nr:ATP-binding cassette domain-containing protein [Candidatus Dormibacteraeota bacterium]